MSTVDAKSAVRSLTVFLPAGRLPLVTLNTVNELAQRYQLEIYFSTAQNLRLLGIREEDFAEVKSRLAAVGCVFKGPGKFPVPKVCIGDVDCKMGKADPARISRLIMDRFQGRTNVKPKFKIAISGCTLSCAGTMLTDIGVMATANGYDIYVGGKGGSFPKIGRRIVRGADEQQVLSVIGTLVDYHDAKTGKKQRMSKLLNEPDFPFPEI